MSTPRIIVFSVFLLFLLGACSSAPAGVRDLSPDDFVSNPPADAIVLDVRTPDEFATSHVPGARLIPYDELPTRLAELGDDRSRPIVVYCESGRRAGIAGNALVDAGFSNVWHLDGDMRAWRESGRPTE